MTEKFAFTSDAYLQARFRNVQEENLCQKYKSCFEGPGKLKDFQLNIPIDPHVKAVVQSMRRVPFSLRDTFKKKLDQLVDLDVIETAEKPIP